MHPVPRYMDAEALGFGLGELTPWYLDARLSRDPESLLWFNWQAICSPWGKKEGLRRLPGGATTKDGGRRKTWVETDVTKRGHDRALSLSLSLSLCTLFLSLSLCVSSIRFISRRVGTNSAGQRSHGIFTATTRVTSTDCITEETSRAEMLTRYSLHNPTSTDMRGIYELQTMFVPYHASSQAFEQLWSLCRSYKKLHLMKIANRRFMSKSSDKIGQTFLRMKWNITWIVIRRSFSMRFLYRCYTSFDNES